ncbi:hypothetical protein L227DRAFT_188575 [Lentinus tigrinus ALCF2SS1-6]|uniref:F-box domain-containing protein n=1 Tax=Lentinus tigrinus ALCF2SS1-6 TaxID=1328759 RepID=A0A5C2S4I9_9APHY|nr:hypothetical protein L227DRAFT_188575 [Lentinus tigrinus ALCF2SS1-6]
MSDLIRQAELLVAGIQNNVGESMISFTEAERLLSILRIAVSATGSIRNSHLSIHKLPNETLALIFSHVPSGLVPGSIINPRGEGGNWDWSFVLIGELSRVLLVCRRWHDVAISTPTLWTSIYVYNHMLSITKRHLRRSGVSPLVCFIRLTQDDGGPTLDFLSEHHDRIRELQLTAPFTWNLHEVPPTLRFPMPSLEQADIRQVPRYHLPDLGPVLERKLLFNGRAQRLRKLSLQKISGFPGNRFERLTDLDLEPASGHKVEGANFLAFLSRCPMLQHLVIRHFSFSTMGFAPRQPLPHLRTLIIWQADNLITCDVLLSSVTLPRDISIVMLLPGIRTVTGTDVGSLDPMTLSPQCQEATRIAITFDQHSIMGVSAVGLAAIHANVVINGHGQSDWMGIISWLSANGSTFTELWLSFSASYSNSSHIPETVATILNNFPSLDSLILLVDDRAVCNSQSGDNNCWLRSGSFPNIPPRISRLRLCLSHDINPGLGLEGMKEYLTSRVRNGSRLSSLVLEFPPVGPQHSAEATFEGLADVVEVRRAWKYTWMEVPDMHRDPPHSLWPKWSEELAWPGSDRVE